MAPTTPVSYEEIRDHYYDRITSGELAPGVKLPTTRRIAEEWGCARATVTRAMQALQEVGLVTSSTAGTNVSRASPAATGSLGSHSQVIASQDGTQIETVNTFTFANFVPAEPHAAEALQVDEGTEVIKRFRYRRTKDGAPVLMSESWAPAANGYAYPRLLVVEEVPGGIEAVAEAIGTRVDDVYEERVRAALATEEQADFYGLERPAPIIVKDHLWFAEGKPFHYGRAWHDPNLWSTYRLPYRDA
jgi:DNA-binding GntR family transcriptional regulator